MIEKLESNNLVYKNDSNKTGTLFLCFSLFAIVAFFVVYFSLPSELVISEVCPHNSNVINDYYGEKTDYIEIYNRSNRAIDLSHYYLSDESNDLHKMSLPNYKIAPKEYYLVFLDSHTATFRLSDGENVYLTNKNGKIISKVDIPIVQTDMAYSLNEDGQYLISNPTPRQSFSSYTVEDKEMISNLKINANHDSGFYDNDFYLELSCIGDLEIYYTLDSTEPNKESSKYTNRILITDKSYDDNIYSNIGEISTEVDYLPNDNVNKCTIVRAIGIDENGNKTEELVRSYFVGYKSKKGYNDLPTISLISNPDNLFDYENGIYVKGKVYDDYQNYSELEINGKKIKDMNHFNSETRPANYWLEDKKDAYIETFNINDSPSFEKIDLSIHGGWTRSYNQKSFNIFEKEVKDNSIFNIFGNNDSLMLRSGGDDAYSTKIRDVLNQKIYVDRNVLIQEFTPVQVFLDGEYWGVYMLQDRIDKSYIAKNYDINQNDILLIKNENVIKDDNELLEEYNDMVNYISNNDMTINENYEIANQLLDIQSYIDFKCFEIYTSRSDGSMKEDINNVALWKTKIVKNDNWYDGKFRYILFDTDSAAENNDMSTIKSDLLSVCLREEMFSSLIKNEQFKQQFITTYMDVINNNFNYEKIHKEIYNLANTIGNSVVESNKRFINADFSIEDYMKNVTDYDDFYLKRKEYAIENLIKDFDIDSNSFTIEIINDFEVEYKLNTIETNTDFVGNYYDIYPISLSTEDERVIGWMINDSLIEENSIQIDLNSNLTIVPVLSNN